MKLYITTMTTYENPDESSDPVNSITSSVLCQSLEECYSHAQTILDEDFEDYELEHTESSAENHLYYIDKDIGFEISFIFTEVTSIK